MMISLRRILHIRRISALSLPLTETYGMLEPIRHHCSRSQFEFGSFRSFGKWFGVNENNDVAEKSQLEIERKIFAAIDRRNRKQATIGSMIYAINKLACNFLDPKFCCENGLTREFWDDEDSCLKFWLAVFDHSETSLALELKDKLKNVGIPYQDFCRTIVDVYFTLDHCNYCILVNKIEPEDVMNVINELDFNNTQYECLRILYCIHDVYGWKISK